MTWLNNFKIALVNEDLDTLANLAEEKPGELSKRELEEGLNLILQALKLFKDKQAEIKKEIQKTKTAKNYIKENYGM